MKKIVLSLMLVVVFTRLSAQENDIKEQILSYKDSEYDFVNKGRRLLIDNLQTFKMEEAIHVKNALLKEFRGNVAEVFSIIEYIHLLFWTREFDELLHYLKDVDFDQPVSNNVRVSSQTDDFLKSVYSHTITNKDVLEIEIKSAWLDEMDSDFLLLLLNDVANTTPYFRPYNSEHVAGINKQADRFLEKYPDSPYEKIVREQIRIAFKDSDWGFYMDFILGAVFNQGEISQQFRNGMAGGLLFEYRHRKMMGILGFDIANQILKKDLAVNNTIWGKGSSGSIGYFYLNAGYLVFENRRWSIYPYAGVGYTEFFAAEKDIDDNENLKKLRLDSFSSQIGLGIDLKISIFSFLEQSSGRIGLKYTYRMPRFERKDPLLSGSQHLITLSYGIGGRARIRDL